jgi:quinol-cytochrome oxidoreductase complex cytochrome b subunit
MSGFLSTLLANVTALPTNLKQGMLPGAQTETDSLTQRMRRNFLFHLHPVHVATRTIAPKATLGLGLMTLTLFLVLALSGALLMLYYIPIPREAYSSTQDLQYAVTLGAFVRALHRWAGHAMVLTAFLHLLRVSFTGAYFRRELNWTIGLGLFLLTLGLAFTGYLLPWDQLSFWAVSVSAGFLDYIPWFGGFLRGLLLGGREVGQAALIRFYMLHVAFLPGLLVGLAVFHVWRIRKDGGLAREPGEDPEALLTVPAWPHLMLREAILMIVLVTLLFLVATFVSAPLGGAPDIHNPSNPEKTPWYFLWVQEMVSYSAPVGGFIFPGFLLVGLFLLPFLEREPEGVGRWFGDPRTRVEVGVSLALSLFFFVLFEWVFMKQGVVSWLASKPPLVRDLLNPATGMLILSGTVFLATGIRVRSTRTAFLAAITALLVAVIGFTFMAWCRGPMWAFFWPWEEWALVP